MSASHERIDDLLVQRATEGLDLPEAAELERLLARASGVDTESIGRAAAAVELSALRSVEQMPEHLRRLIAAAAPAVIDAPASPAGDARALSDRSPRKAAWKWLWATAAAVVFAAVALWRAPLPPIAEQRASLIAAGALQLAWTATQDPAAAGASGDVVWDAESQRGFMRFTALAANEPSRSQYQLWIFDAARDERYPVDGGVFDIPAGAGEVLVPIRAKLPVGNAVMFAVTVEVPGGVVVSSRERIVLLARPG